MKTPRSPRRGRRRGWPILAAALALLCPSPCVGFPQPASGWRAAWIGVEGGSKPNTWTCYRKTLNIANVPNQAVARIACDSKYWLWVNDRLVVFEGELKRGPTPHDTYFDRVDLAPHLKAGDNTIAVLVCYFGRHGFSHNSSGKSGLLFEADIDDTPFDSGPDWKAMVHPAFGEALPALDNERLPEANLRFDARRDIGDWRQTGYDDSGWDAPNVYGVPPTAPWNALYQRPIPQWKDSGLVPYAAAPNLPLQSTGAPVVCRLPYNCQVTPFLKVRASGGEEIVISTDVRDRYGSLATIETHRHTYVARAGVQELELPAWINGHAVHYIAPVGVTYLDLRYRETGYDTEFVGEFDCDDPRLNQLWKEAARTLYVTMRDTYMDCPDRERAQWWGDAVNELGEAAYVFEPRRAPLLTRKAIYELVRWQRSDGALYSPVPSGLPHNGVLDGGDGASGKELPAQMLASVGWYGFWTYYWNTGDRETLADAYPAVKRYLGVWRLDPDGLVQHRAGGWDWSDWGQDIDARVIENAWYALALRGAIEMARVADAGQDIPRYQERLASIRANFNRVLWNGEEYRSPDYTGATDDRANAMAVVAGLAEPGMREAIVNVLKRERHASLYMEKYVLEALLQLGEPDAAFDRMTERYAAMLEDDISTLWELFDPIQIEGVGDLGRGTYNHAWSGGPLTILSQYVAGVSPTAPAFKEYQVLPQPGRLRRIDASVPTQYGSIRIVISRSDAAPFLLAIESPAETLATVGVPIQQLPRRSTIEVNGQPVWRAGRPLGDLPSVKFAGADQDYVRFTASPGAWTFSVTPSGP